MLEVKEIARAHLGKENWFENCTIRIKFPTEK